MASNKNQHFVPRCYLRSFSSDSERETISLFNIDREKFIKRVTIKHQCSRDYFYGQDEKLENAIQFIERAYGACIREIEYKKQIPPKAISILKRFWYLQYTRTEAASRRSVEMSKETDSIIDDNKSWFALGIKEAVQLSLFTYARTLDIIDDLKIVLLKNRTITPIITSDDPAVMVNRWHQYKAMNTGFGCGLQSAGIFCVLPISPDICFLAFDKDVYSIPNKNGWVDVRRSADIESINATQYLNCFANIYYRDDEDSKSILQLHETNNTFRPQVRHKINYAVPVETKNGRTTYVTVDPKNDPKDTNALLHMQSMPISPNKWPSFLRWRIKGVIYSNETGRGHIRYSGIFNNEGPSYQRIRTGY